MSDLPPEIVFDILSRLPLKDLIRFLCISKVWYATINDHRFIKAHLQRSIQTNSGRTILLKSGNAPPSDFFSSPFDDTETFGAAVKIEQPLKFPSDLTVMVGCSINGVVCLSNYNHKGFAVPTQLWNPSIQKFKKIPFPTLEIEQQPPSDLQVITQYGFGYDSANEDYKILAILEFDISRDDGTVSSQLQIYSMKSNSWKRIQNMPGEGFSVQMGVVVFSNGAMSWLMKRRSQAGKNQYIILTLDLASEKYVEFDTPVDEDDNSVLHLHVLGDSLCICVHGIFGSCDIWVL